jgi:hypothetical protein
MRNSRAAAIVGLVLVLGIVLTTLCPAVPMSMGTVSSNMPDDCGGHHRPTPAPAHNCCYSAHHVPAAVQLAAPHVAVNFVVGWIGSLDSSGFQIGPVAAVSADASPPPPAVLRI